MNYPDAHGKLAMEKERLANSRCSTCRHRYHEGFCPNMASDNDCNCKGGEPVPDGAFGDAIDRVINSSTCTHVWTPVLIEGWPIGVTCEGCDTTLSIGDGQVVLPAPVQDFQLAIRGRYRLATDQHGNNVVGELLEISNHAEAMGGHMIQATFRVIPQLNPKGL